MAALLGAAAGLLVWREDLGAYYVVAALGLAALAGLRGRRMTGDVVAAVFWAKAVGAAALAVIEFTDGRTTALALLVQAGVLWVTARRTHSLVMTWASPLAAVVAAGFFVRGGLAGAEWWSVAAAGQAAFALGLLGLAAEWRKREEAIGADDRALWQGVPVFGMVAAVGFGSWSIWHLAPVGSQPVVALGWAGLAVVMAGARRSGGPLAGSAVWVALAHVRLGVEVSAGGGLREWTGSLVVVEAVSVLAVVALARGWGAAAERRAPAARAADALAMLVLATLVHTAWAVWASDVAMAATAGLAFVVGVAAWSSRRLAWTWLASGVLALGALKMGLVASLVNVGTWRPEWLAWGASSVVGLLAWRRATAAGRASEGDWPGAEHRERGAMALATVLALAAIGGLGRDGEQIGWLVGLMVAALALAWRPGVRAALPAAWVLGAAAAWVGLDAQLPFWTGGAALVAAWAAVVGVAAWREREPTFFATAWWERNAVGGQAALATTLSMVLVPETVGADHHVLALAVVAGLTTVWARRRAIPAMAGASRLLGVWTAVVAVVGASRLGVNAWSAAAVLAALPWVGGWGRTKPRWTWVFAGLGLGVAMSTAVSPRLPYAHLATVGWGTAAVAVFMLGLFARLRPHRLVGLAGLALCIVRVFIVDLDQTLHRIAAFGVLGLVLLWVGFSYHRFRHLIADEEAVAPADDSIDGQ